MVRQANDARASLQEKCCAFDQSFIEQARCCLRATREREVDQRLRQ